MAMNGVESAVWKRLQALRKGTLKRRAEMAGGWWLVAREFLLPLSSVSLRAHPFINMELTDEL